MYITEIKNIYVVGTPQLTKPHYCWTEIPTRWNYCTTSRDCSDPHIDRPPHNATCTLDSTECQDSRQCRTIKMAILVLNFISPKVTFILHFFSKCMVTLPIFFSFSPMHHHMSPMHVSMPLCHAGKDMIQIPPHHHMGCSRYPSW